MAENTSKRKRKRRVNKKQEQVTNTEDTKISLEQLDRQKLIETIDRVKSIKKIEWGGGKPTGEKTEDGKDIIQWPYPIYPDGLFESLYLLGSDYDYIKNMKDIKDKDISTMSLEEIRTFLTHIARGERFCDGLLEGYVENGLLAKALERILELHDSQTEGQEILQQDK